MLKVSFKDNFKKVQVFNDKVTTVILIGKVKLPKWLNILPSEVDYWVEDHPTVDFDITYAFDEAMIIVSGKSICADGDVFNAKMGERIAESRAKIKLYKFMHTLCKKLMYCYYGYIYGVPENRRTCKTTILSDYHGGLQDVCRKYAELWIKESRHLGTLLNEE